MADVVARSTQPTLGSIKLAWWREQLEELDQKAVPAEPRLRGAAAELLPRGISGAELARLEQGWAGLLDERPDRSLVAAHGVLLFRLGAGLLEVPFDDALAEAGRMFARADVARRGLADAGPGQVWSKPLRIPRRARPLTALSSLAARDLSKLRQSPEPEGTPGRAWALLRHRMTGRLLLS